MCRICVRGGDSSQPGTKTASGTAAHKSLPFGSTIKLTNKKNGHAVTVTITDRGPYASTSNLLMLACKRIIAAIGSGKGCIRRPIVEAICVYGEAMSAARRDTTAVACRQSGAPRSREFSRACGVGVFWERQSKGQLGRGRQLRRPMVRFPPKGQPLPAMWCHCRDAPCTMLFDLGRHVAGSSNVGRTMMGSRMFRQLGGQCTIRTGLRIPSLSQPRSRGAFFRLPASPMELSAASNPSRLLPTRKMIAQQ
jgi:hypothetical protein